MFGRAGRRTVVTWVIAAFLAAACTSGVGPTAPPQTGGASPSPSSGAPIGPISSPAESTSPAPSGGSPGPSVSPGDIDPCTLLSTNDLARVNGGTYGPGVSSATAKGRLCVWQNTSPREAVTMGLTGGGAARWAALKGSLQGLAEKDITTVGDAAFIARSSAPTTGGIYVEDGDTLFFITYGDGTVPTDADLVGVALEVFARLP